MKLRQHCNELEDLVTLYLRDATSDEAVALMNKLRAEAMRLDRELADPRKTWNSVYDQATMFGDRCACGLVGKDDDCQIPCGLEKT